MGYIEPHMRKALENHILVPVLEDEKIRAFYLKGPKQGRAMSTLILFTPEGIVLQGDLTPTDNGTVSTFGYGLRWFRGELSGSYLCEKFLKKVFRPDLAVARIAEEILTQRREGRISKGRAWVLWSDRPAWCDEHDGRKCYEFWSEELGNDGCDFPAYGYELGAAGWLCAIQERFAALYNAAHPEQASA